MTMIALYVYAPTTFTTDSPIETMAGRLIDPGTVELPIGVYRMADGANVSATSTSATSSYELVRYDVVTANGTKTTYPDPPNLAAQRLGISTQSLGAFLQGSGEETELDAVAAS